MKLLLIDKYTLSAVITNKLTCQLLIPQLKSELLVSVKTFVWENFSENCVELLDAASECVRFYFPSDPPFLHSQVFRGDETMLVTDEQLENTRTRL